MQHHPPQYLHLPLRTHLEEGLLQPSRTGLRRGLMAVVIALCAAALFLLVW
jgi:hypothetical protein